MEIQLRLTITCVKCSHKKEEALPTTVCHFFYDCENCKEILSPKEGDYCVFCSYGTDACPPIQQAKSCC
ncbi:MAG: hypothetical protein ACI83B_002272 [Sediminicola sp.]|jgi:hypothetical protein|tara:strand:- start:5773 stop:5979 length:207 start_codon:yes stop_codon:yes gene_type:complete